MMAKCRDLAVSVPNGPVEAFDFFTQEALSELMVDAYRGTTDWEDGDDESAALAEIRAALRGEYGPFLDYASGCIKTDSGEPASAIVVALFERRPTILFLFTANEHSGKGYAATLIQNAARKLLAEGHEEISLFVSPGNPAIRLYKGLGFTSK